MLLTRLNDEEVSDCVSKGLSEMDFSLFPPSCRFRPTCSVYMIQAIEKHGLKGIIMGIARILRCHPLSETGDDPVPDYFSLKRNKTPLDK